MADFDVYDDGAGNHIIIEMFDGYPGRGLVCPHGSVLMEDVQAFSEPNVPDGYGTMGPVQTVPYMTSHGPIGSVHDGEVIAYASDPYLCA